MAEAVVDASVLVKWFIRETDSDRALKLRDRHVNGEIQLAAPALILYEVLNALKYSGLFSVRELKGVSAAIQNYGLALYPLENKNAGFTLEAAERNDITAYDASYLGLAMDLGSEFITADRELLSKLRGEYAKIATLLGQSR
jgi:predicted nucleic acid-binding protein